MVLVDTSVWVSHLTRGNARLEALLNEAEVLRHDFVVGELACGRLKAREEILTLLQALPAAPVVSHSELLHFIDRKGLMGSGIGFIDAHLLASSQLAGAPLWTSDTRLRRAAARLNLSYPLSR